MIEINIKFDFVTICSKLFPLLIMGIIAFAMYQDGGTTNLLEIMQEVYSVLQALT